MPFESTGIGLNLFLFASKNSFELTQYLLNCPTPSLSLSLLFFESSSFPISHCSLVAPCSHVLHLQFFVLYSGLETDLHSIANVKFPSEYTSMSNFVFSCLGLLF